MGISDIIKYPFWTLALATGAKSFKDNKMIGSAVLNRKGLHAKRVKLAHDLAWSRRARLAKSIAPEDRAAFDRDGFVMKRDFLPPAEFAALRDAALSYRAPVRQSRSEGDTITRRMAL
ncbi:MAG: phytanoyl-CoA dioxygenase, partial [Rhizobiales bacterium]|nr:phytanoyl-CoA dioxygenase [Hyphomicrobiales bacterium]